MIQFNLLIPYFVHKLKSRNDEFEECLHENLQNPLIKNVYLFYEGYNSTDNNLRYSPMMRTIPKLNIWSVESRPGYEEFIRFANIQLNNSYCIIANTDIMFDETLGKIQEEHLDNTLLALTTYNSHDNYKYLRCYKGGSQDSWIFKTPFKEFSCDIKLGVGYCECLFHILCKKNGINVINPSIDIFTRHLHSGADIPHTAGRNDQIDGENYINDCFLRSEYWSYIIPQKLEII